MSDEVIPSALLGVKTTPLPHPSSTHGRGSLVQTRPGLVLALIGLTGGLFGGLLGIGGGSAIAPLLLLLGVFRPSQIAGTTLATVLVISLVGSGAYASLGSLNLGLAWPIALGSVAGSILGARVSKHLSIGLMTSIFLLILPYFALKEFWPSLAAPAIATNLGALVLLGLITGLFSGLLGIGGASLVVPSLVGFFAIGHHAAQGIAITVALADSAAGAATHGHSGNIRYRALLYMVGPAAIGALFGALLSDALAAPMLRYLFGTFVVVIWGLMLARTVDRPLRARIRALAITRSRMLVSGLLNRYGTVREIIPLSKLATSTSRSPSTMGRTVTAQRVMLAMLVTVPLAIGGELFHMGPVFVFSCSALSCIPLSYWLGQSTGSLGDRLGPVSGGLLNATFGNAAEFIISIMALNSGLLVVVRTSLIGSVLGQLLLVLGTSLLVAGLKYRDLGFSKPLVQINFTLMAIAAVAIGLPSVMVLLAPEEAAASAGFLAPTLAVLLLVIYGFSVVFSLKNQPEDPGGDGLHWSVLKGLVVLGASTGGIVFASELLVSNILPLVEATGISTVFIGLILIPIFSNVVDHLVAISMALKNRMDLSLTISVGSAAQVACMVLPAIILISMFMGQPLGLTFTPIELISLGIGLLFMIPVLLDGKSNWLEGAQLLTCYFILAAVLWAIPL